MRGLLRWLRRLALSALVLAVAVLAVALITAHTGWGREQLRHRVEAALGQVFPGARVASLDGSILGTLTLRDVELVRGDRGVRIRAGTLRVAIALWPLLFQTARIDHLIAEDVHAVVRAPEQAPAPGGAAEASPWRLELHDAAIHRAEIEIERARLVLGDLDVSGGASVAAGRAVVSGVAHGRWRRASGPAAELTAQGSAVIAGGVQVPAALVLLDRAMVGAVAVTLDLDHPRGAIAVAAPAAALADLVPELDCGVPCALGDVAAAIELAPGGGESTRLAITASAGEARLRAALRGEPARRTARVMVAAEAIDLGLATRGRLGGRGSGVAVFDADPGGARGALIAHGGVELAGSPIRHAGAVLFGSLDDATTLVLGSGDDALEVAALAGVRVRGGELAIHDGRIAAAARGVRLPCGDAGASAANDAAGGSLPAGSCRRFTGELLASADVTGRLGPHPDLIVTGDVEGRHLADDRGADAGRLRIAALRSHVTLTVNSAPDRPGSEVAVALAGEATGTQLALGDVTLATAHGTYAFGVLPELQIDRAHIEGGGIRRAGGRLGDATVDLERRGARYGVTAAARTAIDGLTVATQASLQRAGSVYRVDLARSGVTLPGGSVWTGLGGTLVASDPFAGGATIQLRGVTLHRGEASAALRGAYAGTTGALALHLDADRLDASTLEAGARGVARGALDLERRGGTWRADATIAVAGFARSPEAAPVDATAHLALVRQEVTLDAHASGASLGGLDLAFAATAPPDPFDLAAWRNRDRDAIHTAAVTARQLALPGLAALLGHGAAVPSGTIDGTADLAPSALRGALAVRGIALPFGTIDGDVTFAPSDGDLGAQTTLRLTGVAEADLVARLAVPPHPFDPATWQQRGRDLVRGAAADLDDLAFDPELLARLGVARWLADRGLSAPYRGHARASLALGAAAGEAQLTVELRGVTGGAFVEPVSPRVAIRADRSGSHVHAELRGGADDRDLGGLDGDVPMTAERWLDEPAAVLRAPITARWTLPATQASAVLAIFGRREVHAGTLEGSATVRGTVGTPIVPEARLIARDIAVVTPPGGRPAPTLRTLEAVASWGGASGRVTLNAGDSSGGELHAALDGRPDALTAVTGTAALRHLDIAPIAMFLPGALISVAGTLDGELALRPGAQVTGRLHVTGGALPLAAAIGTVREATADLASDGRTIIAALDGRLGRGRIRVAADGPADLAAVNLRVHLDAFSPILSVRPLVTADLTASLRREAGQLRGEVVVEPDGTIALTGRTGARLLDPGLPDDLVIAGAPAAPRGPRAPAHPWLVASVTLCPIRLDARDAFEAVSLTARLRSAARPGACDRSGARRLPPGPLAVSIGDAIGVRGQVEILSDDVQIAGQTYRVEPTHDGPSSLIFDGTTDPLLDVRVSHQFPELTLYIDEHSRLGKIEKARLSSEPGGYTENQLMAFALGGSPSTDPSSPSPDRTQELVAGGARFLTGKVGRALNQILPIRLDSLSCEPTPASAASATTSGSCTVGKWWSERVFVAYHGRGQPRPDENANEGQLQIRLGESVLFEGTGGDRSVFGADLLWRHRW